MSFSSFLRWSGKVGIFGGTLYLVTAKGLWSTDEAERNTTIKALQDFPQNAGLSVPVPELNMTSRWNNAVSKTFDLAVDLPDNIVKAGNKGLEYIHDKLK